MKKLNFYDIDNDYINYLRSYDEKVPYINYFNRDKFVCGVVLSVNCFNYFAPISHNVEKQFSNIIITRKSSLTGAETPISSIKFCFMLPAPTSALTLKNFDAEKDDNFRYLLRLEHIFCNKHAAQIQHKAQYIYKRYVGGCDQVLIKNCCNFPLLERAMSDY